MKFEEILPYLKDHANVGIKDKIHISLSKYNEVELTQSLGTCLIHSILFSNEWSLEETGKSFPEVLEAFKEGKKIKRKCWSTYLSIATNETYLYRDDLLAKDWEVIK